ncbi:hypothetical protein DSL72_008098 [Monilinia vaccinii-corymbosi]|uniref:BTB domain-containing protein n=1 Tax=Monilinia vaccinii-corymbosi TaxID=61207 RepID=A0A8A3PJQ5_9HELO|nr:hypothetical protein DSL72_008098 [Monilinia vaccinii-corymbosi]
MGSSKQHVEEGLKQWKNWEGASSATQSVDQSKSMALVKAKPDFLFTDIMGIETISLKVGPSDDTNGSMVFTIHKNLLTASSRRFAKMVQHSPPLERNQMYSIHDTSPCVFKLFNEYIYTGRVPGVHHRTSQVDKGTRISELCQLYVFAEIFEMNALFLNKIMDSIQDGLNISSTVLAHTLVQNILQHAQPDSPLRKFCAANALYSAMTPGLESAGFQWLMKNSDEFFAEFMKMLVKLTKGNDPRIRDFTQNLAKDVPVKGGEELEAGGVLVSAGTAAATGPGVHPCQFHIHGRLESNGGAAHGDDDQEICHLFADHGI